MWSCSCGDGWHRGGGTRRTNLHVGWGCGGAGQAAEGSRQSETLWAMSNCGNECCLPECLQAAIDEPSLVRGVQIMNISLRMLHVSKQAPWQRPLVKSLQVSRGWAGGQGSGWKGPPRGPTIGSRLVQRLRKSSAHSAALQPAPLFEEAVACAARPCRTRCVPARWALGSTARSPTQRVGTLLAAVHAYCMLAAPASCVPSQLQRANRFADVQARLLQPHSS